MKFRFQFFNKLVDAKVLVADHAAPKTLVGPQGRSFDDVRV